nr:multiple epidermal growth factor-like domains protein 10 [Crassostrea gigas]
MHHFMHIFLLCIKGTTLAYDDLSYKKVASQSRTYVGTQYDATNAVDGNIMTCMRAGVIGITASDKTVWWKVDLGGLGNVYSINILFKNYYSYERRQKGRFAGFSVYVSKHGDIRGSTLCYKDGPQLPPLNFTTICAEYGRYVIYYNERLNGVSYPEEYEVKNVFTELCEVSVEGCTQLGVYGNECNKQCPTNCNGSVCNIQNGTCHTCEAGWTGQFCTIKCALGRYGVQCRGICSGHCKGSTTCNHVTGQCDGGCAVGWKGYLCNKECDDGTYGYDCTNNCSGHCLNNSPCNKQTGQCDRGCEPGYTNVFCSDICRPGYYGNGCGHLCNGYCMNNGVCTHVDGVCLAGCQDGYIGKYCNISCKKGYFGKSCSSVCSPHCKTCRHTDGHCSCTAGYTGYRCTTECYQSYGENCHYPCSQHCYNRNCDRYNGSV